MLTKSLWLSWIQSQRRIILWLFQMKSYTYALVVNYPQLLLKHVHYSVLVVCAQRSFDTGNGLIISYWAWKQCCQSEEINVNIVYMDVWSDFACSISWNYSWSPFVLKWIHLIFFSSSFIEKKGKPSNMEALQCFPSWNRKPTSIGEQAETAATPSSFRLSAEPC